jgi:hypothetical protein
VPTSGFSTVVPQSSCTSYASCSPSERVSSAVRVTEKTPVPFAYVIESVVFCTSAAVASAVFHSDGRLNVTHAFDGADGRFVTVRWSVSDCPATTPEISTPSDGASQSMVREIPTGEVDSPSSACIVTVTDSFPSTTSNWLAAL